LKKAFRVLILYFVIVIIETHVVNGAAGLSPPTNYYKDPLLIHTEYIVLLITADTTPVLL
jgi:hypothetical protein